MTRHQGLSRHQRDWMEGIPCTPPRPRLPSFALMTLCFACPATAYWQSRNSNYNTSTTATYYVAAAGNDSNNGLTPATAWQTITHVNAQTFSGPTTVLFNGGDTFATTTGIVLTTTVTAGPITTGSYGTGSATISSGNSASCLTVTNVPNVTVTALTCTGGGNTTNTTPGMQFINNQAGNTYLAGPTITNNTVTGYGDSGILVRGANAASGFTGGLISANTVHDVTGNSTNNQGTSCIQVQGGAFGNGVAAPSIINFTISGNLAFNCNGTTGASHREGSGIFAGQTANSLITGNVVHNTGALSAVGAVGIWAVDSTGITISFNESYNNARAGSADGDGFDLSRLANSEIMWD
jgi:hypothetical protein